ncbi:MAG: hypothetical protein GEU73_10525 [Chloroflexi bacterium]|nr:hypothetical protein [Chloroflexota bacterium]
MRAALPEVRVWLAMRGGRTYAPVGFCNTIWRCPWVFNDLVWRSDRIDHIAKHRLTPGEVEEALFDDPDRRLFRGPRSVRDQTRHVYYAYGRTHAGRYLLVVLLDLGKRQGMPVTARDMTANERHRYGR